MLHEMHMEAGLALAGLQYFISVLVWEWDVLAKNRSRLLIMTLLHNFYPSSSL